MGIKRVFLMLLVLWGGSVSTANASLISLDVAGAGTVREDVSRPISSPLGIFSYTFGAGLNQTFDYYYPGCFGCAGGPHGAGSLIQRGYYLFDLAAIGFPITQASLELQLTQVDTTNLYLFGLETLTATQLAGLSASSTQVQLQSAFTDIGTGTAFGSRMLTSAGTFSIDLTPAALERINGSNGLFAVGVALEHSNIPYITSEVIFNGASLNLSGNPQSVPVPGSMALLAIGGIVLLRQRRNAN